MLVIFAWQDLIFCCKILTKTSLNLFFFFKRIFLLFSAVSYDLSFFSFLVIYRRITVREVGFSSFFFYPRSNQQKIVHFLTASNCCCGPISCFWFFHTHNIIMVGFYIVINQSRSRSSRNLYSKVKPSFFRCPHLSKSKYT